MTARSRSLIEGLAVGSLLGFLVQQLDLFVLLSYWKDRTPWVVAFAVAGALTWATRLRRWLAAATLLGALLWLAVAFTPLCRALSDGLPRRDPVQPADAVFVLASSLQYDGDLTTSAMSRLLHALELLAGDWAPVLVISELPAPYPSYAEASRQLMSNLGIEKEMVAVGPVRNTRDEAVAVGALFRQRGWQRLLVVTSPAHSRRACGALEREGVVALSSPSTVTQYDFEQLALPDERLRAFGDLIHEWVGLAYYRWRGWLPESSD